MLNGVGVGRSAMGFLANVVDLCKEIAKDERTIGQGCLANEHQSVVQRLLYRRGLGCVNHVDNALKEFVARGEMRHELCVFLPVEELLFERFSPMIFAQRAVFMNYSVARHEHCHAILRHSRGHCANGFGFTGAQSQRFIGQRLAALGLHKRLPHLALKGRSLQIERQRVVVTLKDDTPYRVGHHVVLRGWRVGSPMGCQLFDDCCAVPTKESDIANANDGAGNDDGSEGCFGEAINDFVIHCREMWVRW